MRKEKEEVQYIWLDGATIKEDLLVTMAKRSGNMALAEHNILALYRQVLIDNGLGEYVKVENDIRSHYNVMPVPMKDGGDNTTRTYNKKEQETDDKARAIYKGMEVGMRTHFLQQALSMLLINHDGVFNSAIDWCGIYLVIHDRLDAKVNRTAFKKLAIDITPFEWPDELRMAENTLSNFAHYVSYEDRKEAYFDMENNPWCDLCEVFWNVLKRLILTKNLLNNGQVY